MCYIFLQMDWVCGEDWKGPFTQVCVDFCPFHIICIWSPTTQAMFFLGAAIGTVIFGYVGDNYGRFPAFFASNVLLLVSGIALPYCTAFSSFATMRLVMGMCHTTYFTTLYLLSEKQKNQPAFNTQLMGRQIFKSFAYTLLVGHFFNAFFRILNL
jgi:MFS family permease